MADQSFVMEIADLQHDRRDTAFSYGAHKRIPVAYNPGAFTWASAERSIEDRRENMVDALSDAKADRYLGVDGGTAWVRDPEGLADYLIEASIERNSVVDQLADGLVEWPITDQGEPMPINRDALLSLPFAFVLAMYTAIMDDMNPAKNVSSGAGRQRRRR